MRRQGEQPAEKRPAYRAGGLRDEWDHPYSREQAAFPPPWLREHKFWPAVGRIDNVWGDRNLFCSCVPIEEPAE